MPSKPYKVCCAIIGEELVFSVRINKTRIVHRLKERIKEKVAPTLASIGATTLKLYKVNIDISEDDDDNSDDNGDDNDDGDGNDNDETFDTKYNQAIGKISQNKTYTQEIQDLSIEGKQELSNPSRKLSAIFRKSPRNGRIHILVERPQPQGESEPGHDVVPIAHVLRRHRQFGGS